MQAVRPDQPPGAQPRAGHAHARTVLPHLCHAQRQHRHPGRQHGAVQHAVQVGAADAHAGAVAERGLDPAGALDVTDAADGDAGDRQAECGERADRAGHQPLAACLVDRRRAGLDDDRVETGARRVQGGGETGGPAPDDHQVVAGTHAGANWARAVFSQRRRTVSSIALAAVKTAAVSHAECTRGRAATSTTTAR